MLFALVDHRTSVFPQLQPRVSGTIETRAKPAHSRRVALVLNPKSKIQSPKSIAGVARVVACLAAACAAASVSACKSAQTGIKPDNAQMETYAQLVMPATIAIERSWTKPVSYARNGTADGLEVVLAVRDSAGDATKVLGTFHFELQSRKLSERIGTRVAFWPVQIDSEPTLRKYLDPGLHLYIFPLQLDSQPLHAGRYVLSVWLNLPGGERLFDEYEFNYDGGTALPATLL